MSLYNCGHPKECPHCMQNYELANKVLAIKDHDNETIKKLQSELAQLREKCDDYNQTLRSIAAEKCDDYNQTLRSIAAEKCDPSFDEQLQYLTRSQLVCVVNTDTTLARIVLEKWEGKG